MILFIVTSSIKCLFMLTPSDILVTLDNSAAVNYNHFITLSHPYVYLIDSRLNIFRGENDDWAVAAEVLGYNPRGGYITSEIFYFGNCLINLENYQGNTINSYSNCPIDDKSFNATTDIESLLPDAGFWIVRGEKMPLSTNKQDYDKAGITLDEYEPGQIQIIEAVRLAIIDHALLFRATDVELYKSIPANLKKILVLDEWYHREFNPVTSPFDSPNTLRVLDLGQEFIQNMIREDKERTARLNKEEWENNSPGSYETWQQLAAVIATGDTSIYQPTLAPNSHWKNWPESGAL
ncbi:DUF7003 family protein [Mucilaginibacter flavus]|uniref:DUF7003 family protein n=1 Tax=Mucilaginibacter flavus TaxID=931504 RepID=UPI0025B608CE|nr:hypothetical protein [Mucilaginibacter flavus]MDN3584033.1 hypothetical protein [Mucilaginibacter flavus]